MFSPRRIFTTSLHHMQSLRLRLAVRALLLVFGRRIRVEGSERLGSLPDTCIFIFNHNNTLEALLAPTALAYLREGRLTSFLVDWAFLRVPGVGWMARQCRSIPVYSTTPSLPFFMKRRIGSLRHTIIDQCMDRLDSGLSIGLFPEGSRNRNISRLLPPKMGLGPLILRSRAPVVPIGIDYPEKHALGCIPPLGPMVLRVGPCLHFEAERALYHQPQGDRSRQGRQERRRLERHISAHVMRALAPLCSKSAPDEGEAPAGNEATPAHLTSVLGR